MLRISFWQKETFEDKLMDNQCCFLYLMTDSFNKLSTNSHIVTSLAHLSVGILCNKFCHFGSDKVDCYNLRREKSVGCNFTNREGEKYVKFLIAM